MLYEVITSITDEKNKLITKTHSKMKITKWFIPMVFISSLLASCTSKTIESPRLEQDFNQGWKFALINEDVSAADYDDVITSYSIHYTKLYEFKIIKVLITLYNIFLYS